VLYELVFGDLSLGLESDIDNHVVGHDVDYGAGNDLSLLDSLLVLFELGEQCFELLEIG